MGGIGEFMNRKKNSEGEILGDIGLQFKLRGCDTYIKESCKIFARRGVILLGSLTPPPEGSGRGA